MLLPSSLTGAIDAHRLLTNKAEPVPLAAGVGARGGVTTASAVLWLFSTSSSPCPKLTHKRRAIATRRDSFRWGRERARCASRSVTGGFAFLFSIGCWADGESAAAIESRLPWQPRCLR